MKSLINKFSSYVAPEITGTENKSKKPLDNIKPSLFDNSNIGVTDKTGTIDRK